MPFNEFPVQVSLLRLQRRSEVEESHFQVVVLRLKRALKLCKTRR